MEHTILVVEDEQGIREAIGIYMKNQGYNVILAANGKEGLEKIETNDIHLAIVDIMMPVMDGISMVMEARKHHDFPILFLSAKSEDIDKITGLNIGADDYITKPFQSMELVARVRSHLRRYEQILSLKNETKNEDEYMISDLVLNNTTKRVTLNSRDIKLTPKEFDILKLLISHPGQVFSSQQIYELVWKEEAINTKQSWFIFVNYVKKSRPTLKSLFILRLYGGRAIKWRIYNEKEEYIFNNTMCFMHH